MQLTPEQLTGYVEKLVAKHHAFETELTERINDGNARSPEVQRLSKELARLKDIVGEYREYQRVRRQKDEAEKLAKGGDREMADLAREELADLEAREESLLQSFEDFWVEQHQEPERPFMMEIRAGTGGDEASLFAADLFRMYSRYAAEQGWRVQVMQTSPSEAGGFKEIIFAVSGDGSWRQLKYESGVHRVQRVPATEAAGRIHTSTATVAVLPEPEEVELPPIPAKDLQVDVYRATGPGGQGVNTTDSAVRIHHIPSGIIVTCQDERSQTQNRASAMRVLRARLLDEMQRRQQEERASDRRSQVGTGERSEKIRTYNFPDRRVTDHRIGLTLHKLDWVVEGHMDELVQALMRHEREQLLRLGHNG